MKRLAGACSISLLATACSVVLGIDGDVIDRPGSGRPLDLTVEVTKLDLKQGGSAKLTVKRNERAPDVPERLERVVVKSLPRGVTVSGPNEIREGQSITLSLDAAANATLGTSPFAVTTDNDGDAVLDLSLAIAGNLDTGFGDQGYLVIPFAATDYDTRLGLSRDSQKRIHVSYAKDGLAAVARVANGKLDSSFGSGGILTMPDLPASAIGHGVDTRFDPTDAPILFGDFEEITDDAKLTRPFTFKPGLPFEPFPPSPNANVGVYRVLPVQGGGFFALAARAGVDDEDEENLESVLFRVDAMGKRQSDYQTIPGIFATDAARIEEGGFLLFGTAPDDGPARVGRRLGDGAPDESFGPAGFFELPGEGLSGAHTGTVDAKKRTIAVGSFASDAADPDRLLVFRLTGAPAVLDSSFGNGTGRMELRPPASAKATHLNGRAVLSGAGTIIVAASAAQVDVAAGLNTAESLAVVRLNDNGVDTTFGLDGFSIVSLPPLPGSVTPTLVTAERIIEVEDGFIVAAAVDYQNGKNDVLLVHYKR